MADNDKNNGGQRATASVTTDRSAQESRPSPLAAAKVVSPGLIRQSEEPTSVAPTETTSGKMVNIRPMMTVKQCRIAQEYYTFIRGKDQPVPEEIIDHLERQGIIAPAIHGNYR